MILKKVLFLILFLIIGVAAVYIYINDAKKEIVNIDYYAKIDSATSFYSIQKYDSAFYYFNKAKLACSDKEQKRKSYALYYMADIQQINCDFVGSEQTVTEIIKFYPEYENINSVYNLLGLAYKEQSDYENAIKYFQITLKLTDNEEQKCVIKNNIAYVYLDAKKYSKAVEILQPLISNDSLIVSKQNYAKVLDNLGYAYYKLENPEAINYLEKSLKLRDSIKNDFESIASFMHLAEYYQFINVELSKQFTDKAYVSATNVNSPDDKIVALKFKILISDAEDSKKLALKQINLSDSISKVRQSAKNQFSKIKYDSTKAIQDVQIQKEQKLLYLLLLITLTITTILLYFLIRSKNKRKLEETTYNTETRISKKLHDELANDVFNAMMFAETQDLINPAKKEELLETLDTIYARTRNIAKENSDIDTGANFQVNLLNMIASYRTINTNVITQNSTSINWLAINKSIKIAVFRVFQELLVNMKKHSQCSIVIIGFETKDKTIEISYSDNGIGTSELLQFKNGLQNAENRIIDIKGSLTFETESNKGFKAKIIIPR